MNWKNICVYANVFVCSSHVDIRAIIYIFYMDVYIYFKYDNFYTTCILMCMHVCLCTHVRIHCLCGHACVRMMQILLFYLFYNPCQPLYMFTLVPEIHGWRCAIRVSESVIRVRRHGLCVGLFTVLMMPFVLYSCTLSEWRNKNCELYALYGIWSLTPVWFCSKHKESVHHGQLGLWWDSQ